MKGVRELNWVMGNFRGIPGYWDSFNPKIEPKIEILNLLSR